ncbi:MAG: hypothetical protein RBU37_14860 [Myxococcota bacterium]|nr:hypothetical protein [Myxococcota bacterium]
MKEDAGEPADPKLPTAESATQSQVVAQPSLPSVPWFSSVDLGERFVFAATTAGDILRFDPETVSLERVHRFAEVSDLRLFSGGLFGLALTGGVPRLFASNADAELLRFNAWKGASFSANGVLGQTLMIARGDTVGVWNIAEQARAYGAGEGMQDFINRQEAKQELTFPGEVSALSVLDSSTFVVALDSDKGKGLLYLWRASSPEDLVFLGKANATITQVALSWDEGKAAALSEEGKVFLVRTSEQGFSRWTEALTASGLSWTGKGKLLVHATDGTTRAYDDVTGEVHWEYSGNSALDQCWAYHGRLVCSDGRELVFLNGQTGQVLLRLFVTPERWGAYLPNGDFVGDGEAELRFSDGSAPSAGFLAEHRSEARVKAALAAW